MAINETDILTRLSYLLGETTVPTSGIEDRKAFIADTAEEVYRAYPFPETMVNATLSFTNNAATMASNYLPGGEIDLRDQAVGANDDNVYGKVEYDQHDAFAQGSYVYWLTGGAPNWVVETKEPAANLSARYQTKPGMNASLTIPFDDPMPFALGALRYVRLAENPTADISQEESNFQIKVDQLIAQSTRSRRHTPRKTAQERSNWRTGAI